MMTRKSKRLIGKIVVCKRAKIIARMVNKILTNISFLREILFPVFGNLALALPRLIDKFQPRF